MASSNSLEPWSFRPTFSDSWFSDAFTRDTETLTRALQKSLTTTNNNNNYYYPQTQTQTITTSLKSLIDESTSNNNNNNNNNTSSLFQYLVKSEQTPTPTPTSTPTPTGSVSDPDTNILLADNNNINMVVPKRRGTSGRIPKRKSRASKKSPTTFIATDPSNFRQMVQQVTGIQFGGSVTSVLKPEPHRPGTRIHLQHQHNHYSLGLPTLDTSAFLLDNNNNSNHRQFTATTTTTTSNSNSNAPVVVVVVDDGTGLGGGAPPPSSGGLDFENFQSFPTLESWRVM